MFGLSYLSFALRCVKCKQQQMLFVLLCRPLTVTINLFCFGVFFHIYTILQHSATFKQIIRLTWFPSPPYVVLGLQRNLQITGDMKSTIWCCPPNLGASFAANPSTALDR